MEPRWIINQLDNYLNVKNQEEMFTKNIELATQFHSEQLALESLIEYKHQFNWVGIFQIEKIFIAK